MTSYKALLEKNINIPGIKTIKGQENEPPNGVKAQPVKFSNQSEEATSTESVAKKPTPVAEQ